MIKVTLDGTPSAKFLQNDAEKIAYLNKQKKNTLETGIVEFIGYFDGEIRGNNDIFENKCHALIISLVSSLSDASQQPNFLDEQNIFVLTHNLV